MKMSKNQSLWTSVILHVAVLLALFLSTIVEAFLPKEKPHVFEMISEPSPQNAADSSAAPMETPPDFDVPEVEPMADIPDPVMPEPAPVAPTPAPVKPRAEPTPVKPTPAPEPQLMSLDDFRKDNPLKKPKPPRPQPTKPAFKAPQINTKKYSDSLQNNLPTKVHNPSGSLTAAERSALQRYGDQLNSRLNRAWIKPSNLAGVGLMVTVVFDVSSSGRISNVRLRPASGNGSFDASVKAAFTRVGSGGVTPTGQAHSFTMSFKMVD
jgi:protein TonB